MVGRVGRTATSKLSISEARAEAAAVLLRLMLARLAERERAELEEEAMAAAFDIGHRKVIDEVAWLFC
jgi:hypothetical protein